MKQFKSIHNNIYKIKSRTEKPLENSLSPPLSLLSLFLSLSSLSSLALFISLLISLFLYLSVSLTSSLLSLFSLFQFISLPPSLSPPHLHKSPSSHYLRQHSTTFQNKPPKAVLTQCSLSYGKEIETES